MNPESADNLHLSVKKFTRIMIFIAVGFAALYLFIFLQLKQTESQLTSYGSVTDSAIGNFLEQLPESQNVKIEKTVEGISFVVKGGEGSSLNADMLDGHDTSYFVNASNLTSGTLPVNSFSAWKDLETEGITSQGKIKSEYLPTQFSGGTESISWNDIKNRPNGLDDGDDSGNTLTEGEVEGYITNSAINLSAGTTLNSASLATEDWVTAQNYLTGVNFSQVANGAGIFLDYRPDNTACTQGQVLKYDAALSRWICGTDSGAGAVAWGDISGNIADQSDLNAALTTKLGTTASFGGDVTGTYDAIVVTNDGHEHTGATISGLAVADFSSPNISQWTNDSGYITNDTSVPKDNLTNTGTLPFTWSTAELASTVILEGENISLLTNNAGYITGLNHSQVTNANGIYWDYRPNNAACSQDQVLKYDAGLNRWVCGNDTGASSVTWGAITGTLSDQNDLNIALQAKLATAASFGGDVAGTYNNLAVSNDSHDHTAATISGLGVADFTSPNISQWTNDSGFISGVNFAQVANGSNIYLNYKPNDTACSHDQTLKYDAGLSRWVCGNDNGAGTIAWGSINGTLGDQADLSAALSSKLNLTATFGGDASGTYDNLAISNDSHNHTGATITGLGTSNFTSANISQWTNDSGYITGLDVSQVTNGSGKYFNYKPNDTACSNGQTLEYDSANSRWICANDDTGSGGSGGTGEVIIIANNVSPAGATLNDTYNFTTTTTGDYLLFVSTSLYVASPNHVVTLQASVDSTPVGESSMWLNASGTHTTLPPIAVKLANLAAGNHTLTITASGAHTVDVNDRIHAYVQAVGGTNTGVAVNIEQVNGTTDVNTTSLTFVDMPDMSITMDTNGNPVEIVFSAGVGQQSSGAIGTFQLLVDGVAVGASSEVRVPSATVGSTTGFIWTMTPAAGSHTFKVQWNTTAGTLHNRAGTRAEKRILVVKEYLGGTGSGSGTVTVGSMSGSTLFADTTADDDWIGLGATAGRVSFDDQGTDEIAMLNANVGIGTDTPSHLLHVSGDIFVPSQTGSLLVGNYGSISETGGGYSYIQGNNLRASTTTNNKLTKFGSQADAGQYIAMLYNQGIYFGTGLGANDPVGTEYGYADNMRMILGLNGDVGIGGTITSFNTYEGASMVIKSGKVGIGTYAPDQKLHVQTDQNSMIFVGNSQGGAGTYEGIAFGYAENGGAYMKSAIVQEQLGDGAARGKIHILNNGGLDASAASLADARLTVDYNGNIGIGQTSPQHKLDVNGNIGLASSGYINFGATDGSSGYGIRDNAGVIEYKDNSGSWTAFNSLGGGGGGESAPLGYVLLLDQKPAGTDGGSIATGSWVVRDINTEQSDSENLASISSNQITLQPGTYQVHIMSPAMGVGAHRAKLYNVTAGTDLLLGTSIHSLQGDYTQNYSVIMGKITLTTASVLEIQHRVTYTQGSTWGRGHSTNWDSNPEIYTVAEFRKDGTATSFAEQVSVPVLFPILSSGTWTKGVDTSMFTNSRLYNSTQNAYAEWSIPLSAGSWKMELVGQKGTNRGIGTFTIDGTEIGTIDQYAGSYTSNDIYTISGISISSSGNKRLRVTVATKNGSSSDYIYPMSVIQFTKE